jgi:tRNA A-37 threonylcarbamoyl transferase component Bud32
VSTGSKWTCPGFEIVEHPGARVLARPEAVGWIRYVLESGKGIHLAASLDKDVLQMEGRDSVYVIPSKASRSRKAAEAGSEAPEDGPETPEKGSEAPEKGSGTAGEGSEAAEESSEPPGKRWAVRHYTRGGRLVSRLLNDRYLRSSRIRPYHEVAASEEARRRGIPTPRVVAACLYPTRLFYRADLVTEFVHSASDLVMALFSTHKKGAGGAGERMDALQASGELIRQMAGVGVRHRDLHAGNILLKWEGAAPRPHLLDLDRCEVGSRSKQVSAKPMQQRLERSLRKWESRTGIRITEKEWKTLDRAVTP